MANLVHHLMDLRICDIYIDRQIQIQIFIYTYCNYIQLIAFLNQLKKLWATPATPYEFHLADTNLLPLPGPWPRHCGALGFLRPQRKALHQLQRCPSAPTRIPGGVDWRRRRSRVEYSIVYDEDRLDQVGFTYCHHIKKRREETPEVTRNHCSLQLTRFRPI